MSVSCCLFVDRSSQIQHLDDSCRTEIKVLTKDLNQFCIRKFSCSECINCDRCRLCNTDCIGKLNLTFLSKSCCYNILCCITCCISCRTVYLCTVLSGESTAAVTSCSAISPLSPCGPPITKRPVGFMKNLVSSSTSSAGIISSNTYFLISS